MKCPAFAIVIACLPAAAQASVLTPSGVFLDADPLVKLVMLVLVGVTLAAAVVGSRKLVSAEQLTGGSAFLRSMRLIGPLIGLAGAGYVGLSFFIALSNAP